LIYQLHYLPGVDVAIQEESSRAFKDLLEVHLEVEDFELPFRFYPIPESELPYTRIYENQYVKDVRIEIPEGLCGCKDICDESCLNRYSLYECNENICGVGTECSNRAFSNLTGGLAVKLRVFETLDYGLGLWSAQDLVKDQLIAEYVGEVITQMEFEKRQEAKDVSVDTSFRLFFPLAHTSLARIYNYSRPQRGRHTDPKAVHRRERYWECNK
jgi:hypothetical protein